MEGFLHLTWNPPFTLDITNVTDDIHYCINTYNITHNSQHDLLDTACNLTQPEFDFRVANASPCDQFKFQVIPVNGAGNGTSNNIVGYLFDGELSLLSCICTVVFPMFVHYFSTERAFAQ